MPTYQKEQFPIPTPWRLVRELRLRPPPWWMVVTLVMTVAVLFLPIVLSVFGGSGQL